MDSGTSSLELEDYPVQNLKVVRREYGGGKEAGGRRQEA